MALRRGFKTEANQYAREFRQELGIAPNGALCPWRLAKHLEVPVFALSEFAKIDERAAYFLSEKGLWEFSGATVTLRNRRLIILNDGHSDKRQASDLSHELSHCILHHRAKGKTNAFGVRHYDAVQEEEANWLGPALLISEEAALWIARRRLSYERASEQYGATENVIRMRVNLTGAIKRAGVN